MAKEISDKFEIDFEGTIERGLPDRQVFDGCHISNIGRMSYSNTSMKIAITALKAGYDIGEKVKYKVTIEPKE